MILEDTALSKTTQKQKDTAWSHLCMGSRKHELTEAELNRGCPGIGRGEGRNKVILINWCHILIIPICKFGVSYALCMQGMTANITIIH